MQHNKQFITGMLLAAWLFACGCPQGTGTGSGTTARPTSATTDAGLEFTKISAGLPSQILDYIGMTPNGLAGARPAQLVYYSVRESELATVYCRDLQTGTRKKITDVNRLMRGSLAASSDGKVLTYTKAWDLAEFYKDEAVKAPKVVASVMRYDTQAGTEEELFDFRDPQWRNFRSDSYAPVIDATGRRVIVLAYDFDQALLARHLSDWVIYEAEYRKQQKVLTKPELDERVTIMRALLEDERVAPKLSGMGITPSTKGNITSAEAQAMRKLADQAARIDMALLIWDAGQTSKVPLKIPVGNERKYHYIVAAGADTVLLGAREPNASSALPQKLYRCDPASGEISEFVTVPGGISAVQLDDAGTAMLAVYNPYDPSKKEIVTQSHLLRVPLDGSLATDTPLTKDFFGYADISADGQSVIGQDQDDQWLYRFDAATGTADKLLQLLGPVDGLFSSGSGERLTYFEQGLLFKVEIPAAPEQSAQWITDTVFEQYKPAVTEFLTSIGYTLPEGLTYRWEERNGLGKHEVAVELRDPAKPEQPALLRYDVAAQQVTSLWFMQGCPFPIAKELQGSKLDYYGCKAIAEQAIERSGWLPGDTQQIYQPSANPLYDGKTDSYIIVFRDGYWLGKADNAKWVYDKEATLRIVAGNGSIAEMSLVSQQPVQNQPETITLERAEYLIRNEGQMKLPEKMPVEFDLKNVRLTVVPKYVTATGPATYNLKPDYRLCYEIDTYILPERELILISRVDTETGELLGQLDFQPSNITPVQMQ